MSRPLPYPRGDPELMPQALDGLIVYEGLPLMDGGAHELGRSDPVKVWRRLAVFIEECTSVVDSSATVALQEMGWTSTAASRAVRARLSQRFGRPHRAGSGWGPGRLRDYFWGADPDRVEQTLVWLKGLDRLPDVYRSPAVFLGFEAQFRLLDLAADVPPAGREPLAGQGGESYGLQDLDGRGLMALGESRLYARLSEQPTCNLVLSLPFTDVSDELRAYVVELQRRLPFSLSPDHWTRWRLDEARAGYRSSGVRVLPAGGADAGRRPARSTPRRPPSGARERTRRSR